MQAKCGCDLKGKGPEAPPQVVPPRTSLDNTAASAARKTALQPGGLPCPICPAAPVVTHPCMQAMESRGDESISRSVTCGVW